MRAEILVWSAVSGAVLGLFAGAGLLALGVMGAALLPAGWLRLVHRWAPLLVALALLVPLAVGAVLGYLEGRVKLR